MNHANPRTARISVTTVWFCLQRSGSLQSSFGDLGGPTGIASPPTRMREGAEMAVPFRYSFPNSFGESSLFQVSNRFRPSVATEGVTRLHRVCRGARNGPWHVVAHYTASIHPVRSVSRRGGMGRVPLGGVAGRHRHAKPCVNRSQPVSARLRCGQPRFSAVVRSDVAATKIRRY